MKKILFIALILIGIVTFNANSQKMEIYTNTSGEMILQMSDINRGGDQVPTDLRWTVFFHLGQYVHFDINNTFGFYSGIAVRNVGFIMNEKELNSQNESVLVKHIHRTYNLGVPIVFKIGSLKDNFFAFVGAEYEWLFQYKHKYWPSGAGSRNNEKVKYTNWFSNETPSFIPSVFAGVQFPKGIHLKFKYYLQNYMNQDFKDSNGDKPFEDLEVRLFYVSLSFTIPYKGYRTIWIDDDKDDYALR